jgi:Xaa-Pro aminopeptidase
MAGGLARCAAIGMLACAAYAADAWKVAGPPPESWQRDRVADLAAHRKAMREQIGPQSILILYAAEPRNYAGDVDWPYRQENNFYYLTGIAQEGCALVLVPGAEKAKEILFLPPSNPAQETWTGHLLSVDEARKVSGITEVWDARRLNEFLRSLLPQAQSLFPEPAAGRGAGRRVPTSTPAPIPVDVKAEFQGFLDTAANGNAQVYLVDRDAAEHSREQNVAKQLGAVSPAVKVTDATTMFGAMRRIKSARELDILKHAVNITAEGFQRAYAAAGPNVPEYEIQAQFEFTFLRRNAHWGYPCIVGSGVNATTLHYESNRDTMHAGELLLMDDAAEFDGYSVDVTRTIPVSGKFSKEQAEIYRLVYEAQQAGIKMVKPGHQTGRGGPETVQGAANEVFKQGLLKLGLITDPNNAQQLSLWTIHGISHGIGLNVHDPGGPELQPGMVVTVEPGLYFRPEALENLPKTPENEKFIAAVRPVFERYKGIGVRIEDDVLVTASEPQVLSQGIPSKLEDVEAAIARSRKALKTTPLP